MNENMIFLLILGGSGYTSPKDFFHANVNGKFGFFGFSGEVYVYPLQYVAHYTKIWVQLSRG